MSPQTEIPGVPEAVLRNEPKRWGGRLLPDDEPLERPELFATRRDRHGLVQALYKTVENRRNGGRGFIVDSDGWTSQEYGILTLTNSPYWPWDIIP
ncbi:MAG: hypothetical protein ACREPW_09545 [Candidatus Binataceae bacterium]